MSNDCSFTYVTVARAHSEFASGGPSSDEMALRGGLLGVDGGGGGIDFEI
jgi:hypothetical protein